jgi:hypothetical protein
MEKRLPKGQRKLVAKLGPFLQQYAQKAETGRDPNDRPYSRNVERKIKRLPPERLQELMDEL